MADRAISTSAPWTAAAQPINLTATWDLEPTNARWSPDSRFIYFTAETGGEMHLFRVAAQAAGAAKVEQVTKGPRRLGNLTIDKAFTTIAYTVGLHDAPGDLYAADIDGTHERRLTDVNHDLVARAGAQQGRAAAVDEQGRHVDRRLAAAAGELRPGEGPVSARSSSATADRMRRPATASTSRSSSSRPTATSSSTRTSAAPPATATRSSGRRGANGARRTART